MSFYTIKKNDIIGIDLASGARSVARVAGVSSKKIKAFIINGAYDIHFDRETGLAEDEEMTARISFAGPLTQEVEDLICGIEREMMSIRSQPNLSAYQQCIALFNDDRLDPVWKFMWKCHDETFDQQTSVRNSNGAHSSIDDECEMRPRM